MHTTIFQEKAISNFTSVWKATRLSTMKRPTRKQHTRMRTRILVTYLHTIRRISVRSPSTPPSSLPLSVILLYCCFIRNRG